MQRRPDHLAVTLDQEPFASSAKTSWREAGHSEGVDDAAQDGEGEHGPQTGEQLGAHISSPPGS